MKRIYFQTTLSRFILPLFLLLLAVSANAQQTKSPRVPPIKTSEASRPSLVKASIPIRADNGNAGNSSHTLTTASLPMRQSDPAAAALTKTTKAGLASPAGAGPATPGNAKPLPPSATPVQQSAAPAHQK